MFHLEHCYINFSLTSNKVKLECSCVCYCYINLSLIAGGIANGKRKRKYAFKGLSSLDRVGIESVGFLKP